MHENEYHHCLDAGQPSEVIRTRAEHASLDASDTSGGQPFWSFKQGNAKRCTVRPNCVSGGNY